MRKLSYLPRVTVLVGMAVLGLVSCDKLKSAAAQLKKATESSSTEPKVKGTYSREQISDIGVAEYVGFIARPNALVIVDFHAEWCGPCKKLGPILSRATEAYPGVVYLGRVNVDQASDLAAAQKVSSIPDVRIFRNGQEVDRFVGFPGEEAVLEKIAKLCEGVTPAAVVAKQAAADPTVKPYSKGWLPPGMSRPSSATPKHP